MKKKGLSSYIVTIGGGLVVFVLVAVFLAGLRSTTEIVVAGASLPAGARLTAGYLELRQVHTSDVLPGALGSIEEAEGQVVTIARAPGDQITADMLGDAATVGIGSQLQDGHRAVAVHVDQASGLVGVIRPGDSVAVVAVVDPQEAQMQHQTGGYSVPIHTGTGEAEEEEEVAPQNPSPAAYVAVSGLRVLLVPQLFRYEEALPEEDSGGFSPARTSASAQSDSVVLLDVPTDPVEIAGVAGLEMSPAALLPLLDAHARIHLILEPTDGDGAEIEVGAELGDLYRAMIGLAEPVTSTVTAETPAIAPGAVVTPTTGAGE